MEEDRLWKLRGGWFRGVVLRGMKNGAGGFCPGGVWYRLSYLITAVLLWCCFRLYLIVLLPMMAATYHRSVASTSSMDFCVLVESSVKDEKG